MTAKIILCYALPLACAAIALLGLDTAHLASLLP